MGYFNPKPEKNILTDVIVKLAADVLVTIALAGFFIWFLGDKATMIGNSMADGLKNGQEILIDKLSYELRDVKRYDVIVYHSELSGEDEYVIKRVIGLPGEKVQIIDSRIYINGEEIKDPYYKGSFESGYVSEEIILGKTEYFVMGDNRNVSQDSRFEYVGNVEGKEIVGRAWMVISPFNQIKGIK